MSNRLHFYSFPNKQFAEYSFKQRPEYRKDEALCTNCIPEFYPILDRAKPLFREGTPEYDAYKEEGCLIPCVLTKPLLRELVLTYYQLYQKYVIASSIDTGYANKIPTDPRELFHRCMHLGLGDKDDKQAEKDHQHAMFEGEYQLHQQFLIHCTSDGFNALTGDISERFMSMLDNPDVLTGGDTAYDILLQLVYMYKTFDENKQVIVWEW